MMLRPKRNKQKPLGEDKTSHLALPCLGNTAISFTGSSNCKENLQPGSSANKAAQTN